MPNPLKPPVRSQVPDGATVDEHPQNQRPCCIHCANWVCTGCWDFHRQKASRARRDLQYCTRCGSNQGFYVATRHRRDHEPLTTVPFRVPLMADWKKKLTPHTFVSEPGMVYCLVCRPMWRMIDHEIHSKGRKR